MHLTPCTRLEGLQTRLRSSGNMPNSESCFQNFPIPTFPKFPTPTPEHNVNEVWLSTMAKKRTKIILAISILLLSLYMSWALNWSICLNLLITKIHSVYSVPALPLDELGGCLERWAKGGAKKDQKCIIVFRKVTNLHQVKVTEHDESEWTTRSRS